MRITQATVGTLMAIVAVTAPAAAQRGSFGGEALVTVVEVPVRVFDPATGAPVTGLGPADFVIRENGKVMELTNFSEIAEPTRTAGAKRAREESPVRHLVLFFDLYLMQGRDRDRALEAVERRVAAGLPPDTTWSVVSYDGSLRTHLDRSRDARRIAQALEEVGDIRARGLEQRVAFTEALATSEPSDERDLEYYERRQRSEEYMIELERRIERVGEAISSSMARYAAADGRRVLVGFTPGHPETAWAPSYSPTEFLNADAVYPGQDLWHKVAVEAADLGFTLYLVDSSGLRASAQSDAEVGVTDELDEGFIDRSLFAADPTTRRQNPDLEQQGLEDRLAANEIRDVGRWLERTRKAMLITAAESTGGRAFFAGRPEVGVDQVINDLGHWYSLGYTAPHGGDGREYEIAVEVVGRPELEVQHRRAYVDRPASRREAEGIRSAMLFGADANPIGIRVETGEPDSRFALGRAGSKLVQVPVAVKIPIGGLDLVPRGDVYWNKVLITFFGQDANGNQSELASHEQPITVPADQYHKAVTIGYFTYRITLEIEGGEQQVYVGVKDQVSTKTSYVPIEFEF